MAKRKAVEVVTTVSPSKLPKKNKNKNKVQEITKPVEVASPKKHKVKTGKLDKSVSSEASTPSKKKNKLNSSKLGLNPSAADTTISSKSSKSPKKKIKEKKKSVSVPVVVKHESDSEEDVPVEPLLHEHEEIISEEIDLMEIPKEDLTQLLTGIKKLLPESDTMAPRTRAKKLKWESVAFGDYTPDKCAKIWDAILRRQRLYRVMTELVDDAMVWVHTPWKTAKNNKHPDFPKRPKSSFLHFIEDVKAALLLENKDVRITEISRIAGQRYKLLPESERMEYMNRAAADMKKYEIKVDQFYQKYPHLKIAIVPKYLGPKKPRSPFAIFLDHHLSIEDNVSDKVAYRVASKEAWNNLKVKKKLKWIREAVTEHTKYLQELEEYNEKHPDEPVKAIKNVLNKEEQQALHKAEGRPIKPPTSTYLLYIQSVMKNEEYASLGAKERVKAIAAKWTQVTKLEKEKYEKKLHQLQDKYKTDFERYLQKLPEEQRLKVEQEMGKKIKKEKAPKEKRKSITKREITLDAVPKQWDTLTADDKELYKKALHKIRNYFESRANESIKQEPESVLEEVDVDDNDGNADNNDDDADDNEDDSDDDVEDNVQANVPVEEETSDDSDSTEGSDEDSD